MPQIETQDPRTKSRLRWLRVAVTAEGVLVFVQPVSAGSLLSGHYEMLAAHRYGAFATIAVAVVMTALAFRSHGAGGPGLLHLVCALVVVIEAAQISWGYQRVLFVHIPLGVALAAAIVLLLVWVWQPMHSQRSLPGHDARRVGGEGHDPELGRNRR